MDKAEHGNRLKAVMAQRDLSNQALADLMGVGVKTVYNWRVGATLPSDADRVKLRGFLGRYDAEGDPVEVAVRASELTDDRQDTVLGFYKRQLREQREERAS